MNTSNPVSQGAKPISRRAFVNDCAIGAMALASNPVLRAREAGAGKQTAGSGPAHRILPLDADWLFGGKFNPAANAPAFDDSRFTQVSVPHCVTKLSWQKWEPESWRDVWAYRRHFMLPADWKTLRVFLHFDGVMVGATPAINGHVLPQHLGGYLPFRYDITQWLKEGDNVLTVAVDGRPNNVPPGSPDGKARVDYLEAAGITRAVRLEAVPIVHIADVYAKPVKVLGADRRVEIACSLDAAASARGTVEIDTELRDGDRVLARSRQTVRADRAGVTTVALTLSNLGNIALWDVNSHKLYHVVTTLLIDGKPIHDYSVRIGFREARFDVDGFFLNGRRLRLFGLNRHEIYPYVGGAMPRRVVRRDAEILRRDFNCNIVRCSHYPQSPAFLDACDELGLMVWEEVPGWQYIGDAAWKDLLVRDVKDMITRDRNRPSVVIWGTRVNESRSDVELYRRTRTAAKSLDDLRPTSGSMMAATKRNWQRDWHEDVFAFDEYHAAADGTVAISEPLPGVPYMLAEAVGQFNYTQRKEFDSKYRRAGEVALQRAQALRHAQAHSKAGAYPRHGGVIAWCGFDYASLVNPYDAVKCPGVADSFRIPKLGASFYLAQGDPKVRPVIQPNFYWDFGPQTPHGPGRHVAIFSNCERLEVLVAGRRHAALTPDAANYPHLAHPPFFVDLELDGAGYPQLQIDGFLGSRRVLSRFFSSDSKRDRFALQADDRELIADGTDATRLSFKVTDMFGTERAFGTGTVSFEFTGPGTIVGDNPFSLAESGGVGAVWMRAGKDSGRIVIKAVHSTLGPKHISIEVRPVARA